MHRIRIKINSILLEKDFMSRVSFALSWGRKLFFGLSWPITFLLALIYLKSLILPSTAPDLVYYIANLVGVTGLLNICIYIFLYCPMALVLPTYYICRFWSLFLIILLNILVLVDSLLFAGHRLHLDSFLLKIVSEDLNAFPNIKMVYVILTIFVLIVGAVVWIKGNNLWRHMKGRFSNPVSNWYLSLILVCFGIAQVSYYKAEVNPHLAKLFPIESFLKKDSYSQDYGQGIFKYSEWKLACNGKTNPNFIMITFQKWSKDDLNSEIMPNVFHMKNHGWYFNNHFSASHDSEPSIFTLYYSVPPSYYTKTTEQISASMNELLKRQYEIIDVTSSTDEQAFTKIGDWLQSKDLNLYRPYSLHMRLEHANTLNDAKIASLILNLENKGLLKNTYVVMTGGTSNSDDPRVPLLFFAPDEEATEFVHPTSHYDVMPTVMSKLWNCKNSFFVGFSHSLEETSNRDWLMVLDKDKIEIWDFQNSVKTRVEGNEIQDFSLGGNNLKPRRKLILDVLDLKKKYYY